MMELLAISMQFVCDVALGLWGLLESTGLFAWDLLVALHVNHPRLEGLLVGIALAWLLARKDKHPLLRAASAPLNLVISILDLAWDHMTDTYNAVWGTLKDWTVRSRNWALGLMRRWVSDPLMGGLRWLKAKLSRKDEKKES